MNKPQAFSQVNKRHLQNIPIEATKKKMEQVGTLKNQCSIAAKSRIACKRKERTEDSERERERVITYKERHLREVSLSLISSLIAIVKSVLLCNLACLWSDYATLILN